ncbi:MAG TPA: HAMP domain-containing histidine kinase, partial [Nitrospirae bacterium]|nr:HAMP domain-containing histidine kinase [Nitrospirota bacterium]
GIAKAEATSIFNPFFTTKSPDGGMGLGLSIVYRIVENHGGSIDAQSQAGMGTTFKIMLPVNQPVQ